MKESISSVWLTGLIIVFILIFACYIAITVSYTKSFKMKNDVIDIIEKHHGLDDKFTVAEGPGDTMFGNYRRATGLGGFQSVNLYLQGSSYSAMGYCPSNDTDGLWYGITDLDYKKAAHGNFEAVKPGSKKKYYYCISKFDTGKPKGVKSAYYRVRLFYKFELPVLSEFLSIRVDGITDEIYDPIGELVDKTGNKPAPLFNYNGQGFYQDAGSLR